MKAGNGIFIILLNHNGKHSFAQSMGAFSDDHLYKAIFKSFHTYLIGGQSGFLKGQ